MYGRNSIRQLLQRSARRSAGGVVALTPERPQRPRKAPQPETLADVDVAIVCEATYPYLTGGLSAVVHQICEGSPDLSIGIIHIGWDTSTPLIAKYDVPPNVKWIKTYYQAMSEHAGTFQSHTVRDLKMSRKRQKDLVDRVFDAIRAHMHGDDEPLWSLYDDGINPLTRTFPLWSVFSTAEFMQRAVETFGSTSTPLTDLYWRLRDFLSLAYAATAHEFPRAKVYHAHTTGEAALLAAAAARQHSTRFLLTEHNLYTRDTINHLLERGMEERVVTSTWWNLHDYKTGGIHPEQRVVTEAQRAWMLWFTRLGHLAYRAADRITYLYPEAIEEAADLGGVPAKSVLVPNGLQPEPFFAARQQFVDRATARREDGYQWKLAYAARVVTIKGLLDLLGALDELKRRGNMNFVLHVMGPDQEEPEYVQKCHERVRALDLENEVVFRGRVNLQDEFAHFDALLLPSHNEGVPIAILEAMAVGLPILATDVGGIRDVVERPMRAHESNVDIGPCGRVLRTRDTSAMCDAIEELSEQPGLYSIFSRNSVKRLDELFHVDVPLRLYNDAYRELGVGAVAGPSTDALTIFDPLEIETIRV